VRGLWQRHKLTYWRMPASRSPRSTVPPIILYDGQCGLCHRAVRWLVKRDRGQLRYAPLQGSTAASLRAVHPSIPMTLSSVVLVDGEHAFLRSKAFLQVARYLTWPWRLGYWMRWIPAAVLDPIYRVVARYRYRWFGHYQECSLPTAGERERMLP
jgi:predicted DCC family thiol-disulfide oxidoreductase YuxK